MKLIHFKDATYHRPCTVAADDLRRTVERLRETVPLRRRDGTKLCQIDRLVRRGEATSLHLSYVPRHVLEEVCRDLSEHNFQALPEMCLALLLPGDELIGLRRGQSGYYRMYDGQIKGQAARYVADKMNKALDVSPQQREAMYSGSIAGWYTPAAHPSCVLHAKAKHYTE